MRVLIAPQEFKGSLSADEAAQAIAKGIRLARPWWQRDVLPMSDGGPGLLDAMRRAVKADTHAAVVRDPLGRKVLARYVRIRETGEIVIEAAQANGLWHLGPGELDPLNASTEGVGDLIREASGEEPPRMIIGVGGSATTDGGAGMATALGARFLDANGNALPPGTQALRELARIGWERPTGFDDMEIVVATDVRNPLLGPNGAARVYGPQKGASPEQVEVLEAALTRYVDVVRKTMGIDIANVAGGGAAGGLAAGLVAFLGARIVSGFDVVAEATHLASRLEVADLVITGEGSFDSQSSQGKVTGRIIEMAKSAGKDVWVFAGRADVAGENVHTLGELEADSGKAMTNATNLLAALVQRVAGARSS